MTIFISYTQSDRAWAEWIAWQAEAAKGNAGKLDMGKGCIRFKKLEDVLSLSVVHPLMLENGWTFENPDEEKSCVGDDVFGATYLHEIYTRAAPTYTGSVTVPVLWDREQGTIVNNES